MKVCLCSSVFNSFAWNHHEDCVPSNQYLAELSAQLPALELLRLVHDEIQMDVEGNQQAPDGLAVLELCHYSFVPRFAQRVERTFDSHTST